MEPNPTSRKRTALAFALAIGVIGSVKAADVYPPGWACPDFAVSLESTGSAVGFPPKENLAFRGHGLYFAGTGLTWTFTNMTTGTTWSPATSPAAAGAASRVQFNSDGSLTYTVYGSTGLIMFPTDVPAGPSTTWHTGKLVVTFDSLGNTHLESFAGTKTDICAELSN